MKTPALLMSTALVLCALSAPAFAADSGTSRTVERITNPGGPDTVIVVDKGMPNRDVTSLAGQFEDGADIAVTGRVSAKEEGGFLLDRKDGQVRALISDPGDDRVAVGDVVTVYGRLKRVPMDLVQVETEVVALKPSGKTYLTILGHQRTTEMGGAQKSVTLNYHPF